MGSRPDAPRSYSLGAHTEDPDDRYPVGEKRVYRPAGLGVNTQRVYSASGLGICDLQEEGTLYYLHMLTRSGDKSWWRR